MNDYLEKFFIDKGSSKSTKRHYRAAVKLYTRLTDHTLEELIDEADQEEDQRIRWKKRHVKEYLIQFRNYLYANKKEATANLYLNDIKTIYRHYEIELQPLPSFNSKQIDKSYEMSFEDLPTLQELTDAYYEANNVVKCILLFAMSSGMAKVDMLNLTVNSFITACSDYLTETKTETELLRQLYELRNQDVIPCFEGTRKKTDSRFTTFCSPEAAQHIIQYLIGRDAEIKNTYQQVRDKYEQTQKEEFKKKLDSLPCKLELYHQLFKISDSHLDQTFRRINNKLGLEDVGDHTKLRCHMLRKWNASILLNIDGGFSEQEIDVLQGRRMDKTHRAYFHNNKDSLYEKYLMCVDELMLFMKLHEVDIKDYEKLETENKLYKTELETQSTKMVELERLVTETKKKQRELELLLGI